MTQAASPPGSRTHSPGTRQGPLVELLPSSSPSLHMPPTHPHHQQTAHVTPSHSTTTNVTSHAGPMPVPPQGPFAGHKTMMMMNGGMAPAPQGGGMAIKVPPNMHPMKMPPQGMHGDGRLLHNVPMPMNAMPPGMAVPPASAMRGKMPPAQHVNPAQMMMMMRKGPPNAPPWPMPGGHPPMTHPNSPPLPLASANASNTHYNDGRRPSPPLGAGSSVGAGPSSVPMSVHSMTPGSSVNAFPGHSPRPNAPGMSPPQHGRGGRPMMAQPLPPSAIQSQQKMPMSMMMNASSSNGPAGIAMRGGMKMPMSGPGLHGAPHALSATTVYPPQQQGLAPPLSAETSKKPNNGRFNFLRHLRIHNSSSDEDEQGHAGGAAHAPPPASSSQPKPQPVATRLKTPPVTVAPPSPAMQPRWHEPEEDNNNNGGNSSSSNAPRAALPVVLPQSPSQAAAPRFLPTQRDFSSPRDTSQPQAANVSKPLGQAMADMAARHATVAAADVKNESVGVPLPATTANSDDVLVVPPQTSLSNIQPEAGVAARPKQHKASAKHTSSRFGHLILGDSSEDSSDNDDNEDGQHEEQQQQGVKEEQQVAATEPNATTVAHSAPAVAVVTPEVEIPSPAPPLSSTQDALHALSAPTEASEPPPLTQDTLNTMGEEDKERKTSGGNSPPSSSPSPAEKDERQSTAVFATNTSENNNKKTASKSNVSHTAQSSAATRSHTAMPAQKKATPSPVHLLHRAKQGQTHDTTATSTKSKTTPVRHVSPLRRKALAGADAQKAKPHVKSPTPRKSPQQQHNARHTSPKPLSHKPASVEKTKAAASVSRSVSSSPVRSPVTAATPTTASVTSQPNEGEEESKIATPRNEVASPVSSRAHSPSPSSSSSSSAPHDDARIAREVYRLYNALRAQEARELERSGYNSSHSRPGRSHSTRSNLSPHRSRKHPERQYNNNKNSNGALVHSAGHSYAMTSPVRDGHRHRRASDNITSDDEYERRRNGSDGSMRRPVSAFLRRAQSATRTRRGSLDAWDRRDASRAFSAHPSSFSVLSSSLDPTTQVKRGWNASPLRVSAITDRARLRRTQPWSTVGQEGNALRVGKDASQRSPLPPWRYSGVVDARLLAAQPSPLRRPLGYIDVGNGHLTPVRHESPYGQRYMMPRRTHEDVERGTHTPLRTAPKTKTSIVQGNGKADTPTKEEPLIPLVKPAVAEHPYCIPSAVPLATHGVAGRFMGTHTGVVEQEEVKKSTQKKKSELEGDVDDDVTSEGDDVEAVHHAANIQPHSPVEDVIVSSVSDTQLRSSVSPSRGRGERPAKATHSNEPISARNERKISSAARVDQRNGRTASPRTADRAREPIVGQRSRSATLTRPSSARTHQQQHQYDTNGYGLDRRSREPVAGGHAATGTRRRQQHTRASTPVQHSGRFATPVARRQPITHYLEQYDSAHNGEGNEPLRSFLHLSRSSGNIHNTISPIHTQVRNGEDKQRRRTTSAPPRRPPSRPSRDDVVTPQQTPPAQSQGRRQRAQSARVRRDATLVEGEHGGKEEAHGGPKVSREEVRALIARLAQSPPRSQMPPPAALRNAVLAKAAECARAGHTNTSPSITTRSSSGAGKGRGHVPLTATASAACKQWLDELFRSVTPTVVQNGTHKEGGEDNSAAGVRDTTVQPAGPHPSVPVPVVDLRHEFRPCTVEELAQERQRRRALLDKASRERAARRTATSTNSATHATSAAPPVQPLLSPTPTRHELRNTSSTPPYGNTNSPPLSSSPVRVPVVVDSPADGLPFAAYSTFRTKDPSLPSAWALAPARDALAALTGRPAARRIVTLSEPQLPPDEAAASNNGMPAPREDNEGMERKRDEEEDGDPSRILVEEVRLDEQMRPYVVLKSVPRGAAAKAQREAVQRLARPRPVYVRADTPEH